MNIENRRSFVLALAGIASAAISAEAALEYRVLRTGGGEVLSEVSEGVNSGGLDPAILQFTFGLATDEAPAPGELLDSFSIFLEGGSAESSALLLTADASGVLWAPSMPGGLEVSAESITRFSIPYPGSIEPELGNQFAYRVETPLPDGLGESFTFRAELFDNLNGTASAGWFGEMVVPEPRVGLLALPAILFLLLRRR